MNGQTTTTISPFGQVAPSIGNTAEERVSQSNFYQEIISDFSISRKSDDPDIKDIFPDKLPQPREARYSFHILQEWEGYVVSISRETFIARLVDITRNSSIEDEEANFLLDDLEDADRARIRPGAIFRWTIGYRRGPGGSKDRLSRILFRNLPAWTKKELDKNRQDAVVWSSELNGE